MKNRNEIENAQGDLQDTTMQKINSDMEGGFLRRLKYNLPLYVGT